MGRGSAGSDQKLVGQSLSRLAVSAVAVAALPVAALAVVTQMWFAQAMH